MGKNNINSFRLIIALLLFSNLSFGQTNLEEPDTTVIKYESAKEYFEKSKWHFHSRSFYMQTINEGVLKDDYSFAQGAGIGLITAPLKGFQLGVSGYFIFKVFASDIEQVDPSTKLANRYELGQFDVTNHTNHHDLDRLEDLYLRYSFKKNSITIGRMELETPFMNMQDGRMRPTIEECVWIKLKPTNKLEINGGYVWGVSPRSTVNWYSMAESVGIYGMGVNTNGTKSDYKNNLTSQGVYIGQIAYKPIKGVTINFWNSLFENVSNTSLLEFKNEIKINAFGLYQGLMLIKQNAVNFGGSENQLQTYVNKNSEAEVISSQVGVKTKNVNWNLNFTHITKSGRYLMPREWGRDPFYTFMPRERNEGMGNVNAFTTNLNYAWFSGRAKSGIGYGYYSLPSASNFKLNKYGMPSYQQINITSSYNFIKFWQGIELRMLIAYKFNDDNETITLNQTYNKVNMVNFNFIVDIKL